MNETKLNLDKDLLYDLYVNQQLSTPKIANILDCSSKSVRNYLAKYNIPRRSMSDAVRIERDTWSDEKELERSRKFHNTWMNKSEEERKVISDKKHLSPNINSADAVAKAHKTRELNGTTRQSKSENQFYNTLLIYGFEKDDIVRNSVIDSRYPFNCDFYIKSKDLFIEFQGHQTHGTEPFDENIPKHQALLQQYNDKGYDMSTWTTIDPKKLKTALNNKISLLLIYPKHKCYLAKNGKLTTIDINDINKI